MLAANWVTGGVLMGTQAKVVLAAVVVSIASAVIWTETRHSAVEIDRSAPPDAAALAGPPADDPVIEHTQLRASSASSADRRSIVLERAEQPDVQLDRIVFGAILAPNRPPPLGARAELRDEWGDSLDTDIGGSTSYSIAGLHAGRWMLSVVDCPGLFAPARELDLGAEPSVRADIELRLAPSIGVRLVTSTGAPLESQFRDDAWHGAYTTHWEVVATHEPLKADTSGPEIARLRCGTYTSSAEARNAGRARVPAGYSGVLELERPPPAYASALLRGRVLTTVPIDDKTTEVTLVIDPELALASMGALRFRLVAARTGEPISTAGVRLAEESTGDWANPVMFPLEDGQFERLRLPPGRYELQLRIPGLEHMVSTITIQSGRTTDLGDVLVEEGGVVSGRVLDESGDGLSLPIGWSILDADRNGTFIQMDRSTSDGRFGLAELPTSGILLRIHDPEWALDPTVVRAPPGVVQEVTLLARRGTAVAIRHRGADDALVEMLLRRADGTVIWSSSDLGARTHRIRLVAGSYTLEERRAGRPIASRAFEVAAEPLQIDLAQ